MADAERYDLRTNTWGKIANLQEPRAGASGAAANGKIFVYGDYFAGWSRGYNYEDEFAKCTTRHQMNGIL